MVGTAAPIRLKTETFTLTPGETIAIPKTLTIGQIEEGRFNYYIVQFDGPISEAYNLNTRGSFSVSGVSCTSSDIFNCTAGSLGPTTSCTFSSSLYWDGSAFGYCSENMDGFYISRP